MASGQIGTAYVQVVPSMEGVAPEIKKHLDGAGESSGASFGSKLGGAIKGAIVAAGIGKALKEAITAGADLQQSLGGIETLFKDSADTVIASAQQAYKTAGLSANEYMQSVTGFSASLLQGLGGDTAKAAAIADMALTDMSDNANKMGTSMQSIQDAYQGFAKQNYTMLDNLKLGYGGTKTEMQRLLADAQKLTGVKYDINNLSDVYSAVHAIQEEMGITGTTAQEASTTFTGSLAAMKAAAQNVLGNLALGEDIGPSLQALGDTVFTFVTGNLLPMVGNVLGGLPDVINAAFNIGVQGLNLVADNAESIVQTGVELVTSIGTSIITALPLLAEAGLNVVTAIGGALLSTDWSQIGTDVMNTLRTSMDTAAGLILGTDGNIVQSVLAAITSNLPSVLNGGVNIVMGIANGIMQQLPGLLGIVGDLMSQLMAALLAVLPDVLNAGVSLISQLATGLLQQLPDLLASAGDIVSQLITTLLAALPDALAAGVSLIGQLATGLINNLPALHGSAADVVAQLLASIGAALPEMLAQGLALIGQLVAGLIQAIPQVVAAIPKIITNIISAFGAQDWGTIGSNIISGIARGISAGVGAIVSAARQAAASALNAAKKFLGIASPSKVMRDQVGKFIPEGVAVGIESNTKPLMEAMHDLSDLTTGTLQADLRFSDLSPIAAQPSRVYGDTSMVFHVYASENQDVDELVEILMQKIQIAKEQREAALSNG